jgi:hypothetical protein
VPIVDADVEPLMFPVTERTPPETVVAPVKVFELPESTQVLAADLVREMTEPEASAILPANVFVPVLTPVKVSVLAPVPLISRSVLMVMLSPAVVLALSIVPPPVVPARSIWRLFKIIGPVAVVVHWKVPVPVVLPSRMAPLAVAESAKLAIAAVTTLVAVPPITSGPWKVLPVFERVNVRAVALLVERIKPPVPVMAPDSVGPAMFPML